VRHNLNLKLVLCFCSGLLPYNTDVVTTIDIVEEQRNVVKCRLETPEIS